MLLETTEKETRLKLEQLVAAAILAPSGDNLQPWRFSIAGNTIDLFLEASQNCRFFECDHRTLYLAAGAAIENMRVEAALQQLSLSCNYFPSKDPLHVARIVCARAAPGSTGFTHETMVARCTNRKTYRRGVLLSAPVRQSILAAGSVNEQLKLHLIEHGDNRFSKLSRLCSSADRYRFHLSRLQMRETIKFGRKSGDCLEGLPERTLELGLVNRLALRLSLASSLATKVLSIMGGTGLAERLALEQFLSSSALLVISAPDWSPEHFLLGGELMERVWLTGTRHGLALQPMTGLGVFLYNLRFRPDELPSRLMQEQLAATAHQLATLLQIPEESGLIFVFRLGYATAPTARTRRRPLSSFMPH